MTHTCRPCGHTFDIVRHEKVIVGNRLHIITGTGKNMAYRGDMNREYAHCPKCGLLEHQYSAEERDMNPDTDA